MAQAVIFPKMGQTMEEGAIVKWHKKEGDEIKKGDILFEIERHAANQAFDYNSDKYNIEHILPEHPNESWTTFTDEQIDRNIYRLGNLTPLETTANRAVGNESYEEKRDVYKRSGFEITRHVEIDHREWTPERVASRQKWLANQATAIWRLPEL